jgi:type II secretory ATPase GspE/PulE/Tfp pilus assembly ATPase PilB-like protein
MNCIVGGKGSRAGFHGRVAVYKLLEMRAERRKPVRAGARKDELEARTVEEGIVPIHEVSPAVTMIGWRLASRGAAPLPIRRFP